MSDTHVSADPAGRLGSQRHLDSLLTGDNAAFVDGLFEDWQSDPTSVSADWAELFAAATAGGSGAPVQIGPRQPARSVFNPASGGDSSTKAEVLAAARR
jgi:2-oxoglutarate dehydrogenase complex dehydrogenase (E1) component-like enzyme